VVYLMNSRLLIIPNSPFSTPGFWLYLLWYRVSILFSRVTSSARKQVFSWLLLLAPRDKLVTQKRYGERT
jgi:hypothetical protein